jgi:hypothetical protein
MKYYLLFKNFKCGGGMNIEVIFVDLTARQPELVVRK